MKMTSADVIERLRTENLDQFFTLVRMHLSFVVDINTDDVDCSTDKPKQFRWNFHKKTKNSSSNSSQSNVNSTKNSREGSSITEEHTLSRLNELIDFLSKPENVTQEGIFRRTGSLSRQQELRQLLLTGSCLSLDEGKFSVHDCASVLKGFLAELPQPLLMEQYYQTYCMLAVQYLPNAESSETKLLTALQLLLLLLSPSHRNFLQQLLRLLHLVADNETSNRMSPDTLATMFTPHLLCPRKLSPETFHADSIALSPVISFMIRQCSRLFEAPSRLATDAAAYCAARERHKDLDESITDKTAANTIYTFVDRHRTRAENETNPTDTALAQLYAHIQALPDSHHKRRLIKHFNRQNGYGTPLQIQRTGKVAGSRSFGDSIKKHIFNKGLLKTPKKGSGSNFSTIEKSSKSKLRYTDDNKVDVSHKTVVLKNLANKIASSESLDDNDYNSDSSNESTLSEGALSKSRRLSPKFVSEPNLSLLENEETPKNTKKHTRLFRSNILNSQNANKKYQKRNIIRGTPTSCVSCIDDQDTGSENDISRPATPHPEIIKDYKNRIEETPKNVSNDSDEEIENLDSKIHYLTSTPGISEAIGFSDNCSTPYNVNFRRASMSPITKSTQKLSKAMQESIMTPRSRKPLIVTSEQRDSLPESNQQNKNETVKSEAMYSVSPKNDSDFVSSDDDNEMMSRSSFSCRSNSVDLSATGMKPYESRSASVGDLSPLRPESTRFIINHERPTVDVDLNTTSDDLLPNFKISHEVNSSRDKIRSLTEPFREYLLSRSVLTATPIDLSILNKSNETDDKITDSLMYCLDGNVPSDLTSSITNLMVETPHSSRSPLMNINNQINSDKSPIRKRCVTHGTKEDLETLNKRVHCVDKENSDLRMDYEIRETDL